MRGHEHVGRYRRGKELGQEGCGGYFSVDISIFFFSDFSTK